MIKLPIDWGAGSWSGDRTGAWSRSRSRSMSGAYSCSRITHD